MSSASGPLRKKPRVEPPVEVIDEGLGGLYDFLPPPDPEKDALAKTTADNRNVARPKLPPEDKTRVIFLDVDGVILPSGSVETIILDGVALPVWDKIKESDFGSAAMGSLRSIVERTGAMIVLSSEWRRTETLRSSIQAVLRSHDLQFRDWTPVLQPKPEIQKNHPVLAWCERRAREVGIWLKEHREVTAWVALDDLDFSLADNIRATGTPFMKYRSVHTHDRLCLTEAQGDEAVQLLLSPPPEPKVRQRRSRLMDAEEMSMLTSTEDSPDRIRLG